MTSAMDRRSLLTNAVLGGAALVGGSALGSFAPEAAFAAMKPVGMGPSQRFQASPTKIEPGAADPNFVEGRSFARAGVLAGACLLTLWAGSGWPAALAGRPLAAVAILLGEAAAVVALSPELDRVWLVPLRRLRLRLSHPLARRAAFETPIQSTVQQLQRSNAYREVARLLVSDVREHWDDGEWRLLCYTARRDGRTTTAVFAVPRLRYEPAAVRVALVDDV